MLYLIIKCCIKLTTNIRLYVNYYKLYRIVNYKRCICRRECRSKNFKSFYSKNFFKNVLFS